MAKQYDPTEVFINKGNHTVTGFAEDSMVTAEPLEDRVELVKGAQGEGTFVVNANDGGQITITLAHNSPSIREFNRSYKAKEVFSIDVMDMNESPVSSAGGTEAMVQSMGSYERGGDVSDREITIVVDDYSELPT